MSNDQKREHYWTRRDWCKMAGAAIAGLPWGLKAAARPMYKRRFHVCLSPRIINEEPAYLEAARSAGVTAVWLAGFFYGYWPYPVSMIQQARRRILDAGLDAGLVNIPLGHPGDSLGAQDGDFPLTPPRHWQLGTNALGKTYAGTSLHEPATHENAIALRALKKLQFEKAFLDDDFRLARGPGDIGGCFCDAHRRAFLNKTGLAGTRWQELLDEVQGRKLTRLVRLWIEFTCDELTESFQEQQKNFDGDLGIMAMYLGAEKAGIRLTDYRRHLFRVGELMFNDASFSPIKGKTDELFSVLFHRQFTNPEKTFSETTAYPADQLSAKNLAAKLAISTIADVRHTMFMSGLTPFPIKHWDVLGPAMHTQKRLHERIAGQKLKGPLKLYWGEAERLIGNDQPFSLWLAMGIPFEFATNPSSGWVFLSDYDAKHLSSKGWNTKAQVINRPTSGASGVTGWSSVKEDFGELLRLKHNLLPQISQKPFTPYVEDDLPVVCAWYPGAKCALIWNLQEKPVELTVIYGKQRRAVRAGALETVFVSLTMG